jgi:acyl-CoA dehydrogenase
MNELTQLVDDIGRRSFDARFGHRGVREEFDDALWRHLEETGLSRLTSDQDAGPAEAAILLAGLARHAGAVPIAETDLLACWLAATAGVDVPGSGPLTIATADAEAIVGRIRGLANQVPWPRTTGILLAARGADELHITVIDHPQVVDGHNLAGEPRGTITFDLPADQFARVSLAVGDELVRRGAWARCVQTIGVLDAAAALTVAHTRERQQFGRPLSAFQAVQHSLAAMAGEIERARAATTLAITAAADYGFDSAKTDYAVTVAKVAVGRAVQPVTTIAHQLHGAIGVTREHQLWLGRRLRQHRALRAAARSYDAGGRRPVGRRRQLSSTSLTRASTSFSPVRSIPNRSVSASMTCAAVSKRIRSLLPLLCIARLRPRRFHRASSVTSAAVSPATK